MSQEAIDVIGNGMRFSATQNPILAVISPHSTTSHPPQTTHAFGDYRTVLRNELDRRIKQNPCYSLRAFARDLQLAPSRISEILNYKQGLSRRAAERIAMRLRLSHDKSNHFMDLVTASHARSPKARQTAKLRLLRGHLQSDAFSDVSYALHDGATPIDPTQICAQ